MKLTISLLMAAILWLSAQAAAPEFRLALPGYRFQFPEDHAAHPDFKTEWWYYTGHLQTADGRPFGFELTFFRSGSGLRTLPAGTQWALKDVYPAHFAVTDHQNKRFFFQHRLGRTGVSANARTDVYDVTNGNWQATQLGERMLIQADHPDYAIKLLLTPQKPPIIHGVNGVSQKADCRGCASHYYSLTRLKAEGLLVQGNQAMSVTGSAWMDHEFGSNQLTPDQVGWDWFSLQLNDNTELMLYQMRLKNGESDPNSSGTWVPGTQGQHLTRKDFIITPTGHWKSPDSGATYPMGWRLQVPKADLTLTVSPVMPNQELVTKGSIGITYWEGACQVTGTRAGKPVNGRGYVEMTGYDKAFRTRI